MRSLPWYHHALRGFGVAGFLASRRIAEEHPGARVTNVTGVVEINLRAAEFSYGTSCTVEGVGQINDLRQRVATIKWWAGDNSPSS